MIAHTPLKTGLKTN